MKYRVGVEVCHPEETFGRGTRIKFMNFEGKNRHSQEKFDIRRIFYGIWKENLGIHRKISWCCWKISWHRWHLWRRSEPTVMKITQEEFRSCELQMDISSLLRDRSQMTSPLKVRFCPPPMSLFPSKKGSRTGRYQSLTSLPTIQFSDHSKSKAQTTSRQQPREAPSRCRSQKPIIFRRTKNEHQFFFTTGRKSASR